MPRAVGDTTTATKHLSHHTVEATTQTPLFLCALLRAGAATTAATAFGTAMILLLIIVTLISTSSLEGVGGGGVKSFRHIEAEDKAGDTPQAGANSIAQTTEAPSSALLLPLLLPSLLVVVVAGGTMMTFPMDTWGRGLHMHLLPLLLPLLYPYYHHLFLLPPLHSRRINHLGRSLLHGQRRSSSSGGGSSLFHA